MNRREFLGVVPAADGMAPEAGAAQAGPEGPSVIWLCADRHRAQALGRNEDPNARTPNLDTMARAGVHFTNAVSGFPLSCPFRGAFFLGIFEPLRDPHLFAMARCDRGFVEWPGEA